MARSSLDETDVDARTESDTAPVGPPPGPDGLPLLGNTLSFLRDPIEFYENCGTYDSDVVQFSIGGDDGYLLRHPDDIERVLVTDASDFCRADVTKDSLGKIVDGGLFLDEDEKWRRERAALQPAFYRDRIETYAEMMGRYADERADDWTGEEAVTVTDEMRTLTLEILAKTLLDVDIRGQESDIGAAAEAITSHFDAGSISSFLPLWVPTPANVRAKRAVGDLDETIEEMVATRRASDDDPGDLLSILLTVEFDDGGSLSDQDIRDQLFTFLLAGHETTALTLSYALFLLANNPEKQARLHDELDAVLDGEPPTATDLFELEYLGNVIDETLRLYPPAYTILRQSTRDVTFQGYDVPAGSVVSMPQWLVHRDDRWYDDPDAFRPERWSDDRADDRPEYAYYPFGGGPRHCIGMRFAMMEAKIVLATLASQYRFVPVTEPPIELSMQITLQPEDDIEVGLQKR